MMLMWCLALFVACGVYSVGGEPSQTSATTTQKEVIPANPAAVDYSKEYCMKKDECKSTVHFEDGTKMVFKEKEEIEKVMKTKIKEDIIDKILFVPYFKRFEMYLDTIKENVDIMVPESTSHVSHYGFYQLFQSPAEVLAFALGVAFQSKRYETALQILFTVSNQGVANVLKAYKTIFNEEFEKMVDDSNTLDKFNHYNYFVALLKGRIDANKCKGREENKPADKAKIQQDVDELYQMMKNRKLVEDKLNELFLNNSWDHIKAFVTGFKPTGAPADLDFYKMLKDVNLYGYEDMGQLYAALGRIHEDPYKYLLTYLVDNIKQKNYFEANSIIVGRAEIDLNNIMMADTKMAKEAADNVKCDGFCLVSTLNLLKMVKRLVISAQGQARDTLVQIEGQIQNEIPKDKATLRTQLGFPKINFNWRTPSLTTWYTGGTQNW